MEAPPTTGEGCSESEDEWYEAAEDDVYTTDEEPSAGGPDGGRAVAALAGGRESLEDSEALRQMTMIKDLDTGNAYSLEPTYRIKDLDTGKEFIVGGDAVGVEAAPRVKDMQTGKDLSLDEFQSSLEKSSPLIRELERRERLSQFNDDESGATRNGLEEGGAAPPGTAAAAAAAAAKPAKKRNPKHWLEKRVKSGTTAVAGKMSNGLGKISNGLGQLKSMGKTAAGQDAAAEGAREERADSGRHTSARAVAAAGPAPTPAPRGGGPAPQSGGGVEQLSAARNGVSARPARRAAPQLKTGKAQNVSTHCKLYKEFTDLRQVQSLKEHQGAVWTMKFSHCGQYMASAGQDTVVRLWKLARPLMPPGSAAAAAGDGAAEPPTPADPLASLQVQDLFETAPYRLFVGHEADVLDLCWSATQFLLSSSMDKSVRLWHVSMAECLRVFQHPDFVTALDFNPLNDKLFLSASLDEKLRIWNIPEHEVADEVDMHEMVTAACFSSDGARAVAGSYKGKLRFYNVNNGDKLEYVSQLDVKNAAAHSKGGKKITGLQFVPGDSDKLLVTSNDSRLRLYSGHTLLCKYKGLKNFNSQIRASFCAEGNFIVCGSEDARVYIWSTVNTLVPSINPFYTGFRRDKHRSYETFAAHKNMVTAALLAPPGARCKPPALPVVAGPKPTPAANALLNPESARWFSTLSEEEMAEATAAGEAAMAKLQALGQLVVTAGYSGEIHIFENFGMPSWI